MVYGCDICQDVCPWNRGIEKRRRKSPVPEAAAPTVSLKEWLEGDDEELVADFERLYVPRNDARWLRRNALIAAGNAGTPELVHAVESYRESDDPVLRDAADWALGRIAGSPRDE
jgi:epoxyqueuosine reductase